jgi:hypothetical protein
LASGYINTRGGDNDGKQQQLHRKPGSAQTKTGKMPGQDQLAMLRDEEKRKRKPIPEKT